MRVTIFGSGYVGLVTGACLADAGNHVVCVDVDAGRIERLNRGEVPIYEAGLRELIARNEAAGRLRFTTVRPGRNCHQGQAVPCQGKEIPAREVNERTACHERLLR